MSNRPEQPPQIYKNGRSKSATELGHIRQCHHGQRADWCDICHPDKNHQPENTRQSILHEVIEAIKEAIIHDTDTKRKVIRAVEKRLGGGE